MNASNAVPPSAVTRTLGYALDYIDLQTAQANLPVKILVLTDGVFDDVVVNGENVARTKVVSATSKKLEAAGLEKEDLAFEVMGILDRLNASQFVDVLTIPTPADAAEEQNKQAIAAAVEAGLGDIWYNLIVNPFGTNSNVLSALKEINGKPDENGGTGRWNALKVKPFVAISGTHINNFVATDQSGIIQFTAPNDLTNIIATAPNAFKDTIVGYQKEEENDYDTGVNGNEDGDAENGIAATTYGNNEKDGEEDDEEVKLPIYLTPRQKDARIAASWAFLAFRQFSAKPYLDISGHVLPFVDYPKDLNIGMMSNFNDRDQIVKNGICTCPLDAGQGGYVVQDFVTGRRVGTNEMARDWNWVRNLFVDFNFAYQYQILQERTLMDKVIVGDDAIINPSAKRDFIRLKTWKATVANFFERMEAGLFITDAEFSVDSLIVEVSSTNPKRINTQFAYKRTSTVNIASTTAYVGFAFGE